MWTTPIGVMRVVIRAHALSRLWIRVADSKGPVFRRQTVRSWKGPEVAIERAIFLHDNNHVADLMNSRGNRGTGWCQGLALQHEATWNNQQQGRQCAQPYARCCIGQSKVF